MLEENRRSWSGAVVDVDHALGDDSVAEFGEKRNATAGSPVCDIRIDCTFVAVGSLGVDVEGSGGVFNRRSAKEGAFDENRLSGPLDFAFLAAHDAGDGDGGICISDHEHRRVERAIDAIERADFFAIIRLTDDDGTIGEVGVIECVERLTALQHDVVCDVDDKTERADAASLQAGDHPIGGWAILDVREDAGGISGAILALDDDLSERIDIDAGFDKIDGGLFERAVQNGCELAGDADDGEAVGAIPSDFEVENRFALGKGIDEKSSGRERGIQLHDAIVVG